MEQGIPAAWNFVGKPQIEWIHQTSLYLLEKYGVKVDDPAVRENLYQYSCCVDGNRVRFAPDFLNKVLGHVKKEISFIGPRGGRLTAGPGQVLSHSTGGIPSIIDFNTGKKRRATLADLREVTRLMNHLDQLDMPCALLYPEDVPREISQVIQMEQLLRYSEKVVYGPGVSSPGEAKYIAELFQVFTGKGASAGEPLGVVGVSPESPLYFPKEITDTMQVIVAAGIPTVMLAAPVAGISAPLTIAGALAQMNAEMLAFAAIAFTINPETALIYGSRLNYPNLKNGNSLWGLPEIGIGNSIAVQLADFYGFLSDVYGLSCTSCTFDNQIGYEKSINSILPVLSGANLISGFGSMANLMLASYEQLVIDNETFAIMRRVKKGIEVNDETLALEVSASVLAGGTFLEQEHTVKHLRKGEIFMPKVGFASSWAEWEGSGKRDIRSRAREFVENLPGDGGAEPLSPKLDKELTRIVKLAEQELTKK